MAIDLHGTLAKQYLAPLEMIRRAVDLCPESLWHSDGYNNHFWYIAYHALFYTRFYLHPTEAEVVAWPKHGPNYNFLGPSTGAALRKT
jgi:hypothetical protein